MSEIEAINHNILVLYKEISFIKTLLLKNSSLNNIFDTIYETNAWGCGSGSGSNEELMRGYVAFLEDFMHKNNIKSVADVGCGDWQFSKNIDYSGISYTGYDVASFVINANKEKYSKENVSFVHYNGDFNEIKGADLLICKDVLQHLPLENIEQFLKILPKFRFALITNDLPNGKNGELNSQINAGQYRPLDLRAKPFNLNAKCVFVVNRMPKEPDMCVLLWSRE